MGRLGKRVTPSKRKSVKTRDAFAMQYIEYTCKCSENTEITKVSIHLFGYFNLNYWEYGLSPNGLSPNPPYSVKRDYSDIRSGRGAQNIMAISIYVPYVAHPN